MNIEIGSLLVAGAKSLGETLLNELKNYLDNKKNWGQETNLKLSEDARVEVLEGERKILGQYTDIYQIRNGEIYKFNNNVEPEYLGNTELENGIYRKNENNEYQLDINLNQEINNKISEMKNDIILKEKERLNQNRVEGEKYIVDEIGDDEKYVYLTRTSNGTEFQEFEISDQLYEELLNENTNEKINLVYSNGEYKIVK
ncbi:unknown [Clostridium sp. CAG:793]|nr:unknown [Clostridium sp. CAG:793]